MKKYIGITNIERIFMDNRKTKKIISIIAIVTAVLLMIGIYAYKKSNKNDSSTVNSKETTQSETGSNEKSSKPTSDNSSSKEASDRGNVDIETGQPIDFQAIAAEHKPIIVNFGSEGCPPCRKLKPVLQSLSDKYGDKLYIRYVDIWKHPDFQGDFQFEYIPSQVIFNKDGSPYIPSKEMIESYQFQLVKDSSGKHIYTMHQGSLPQEVLSEIIEGII